MACAPARLVGAATVAILPSTSVSTPCAASEDIMECVVCASLCVLHLESAYYFIPSFLTRRVDHDTPQSHVRSMGGRKAAGRGGRGGGRGRGRGDMGRGAGRGAGRGGASTSRHVGGGGRKSSSGGLYGPEDGDAEFVSLRGGGGPKRKHRQMFGAYGTVTGGRRVRKPDDDSSSSSTTSDDSDIDEDLLPSGSDDDVDEDPNVDTAHVMRVGGIEIRLDDRGAGNRVGTPLHRGSRHFIEPPYDHDVQSDEAGDFFDSDTSDSNEWNTELSLDDDAIRDYMANCMEGSDEESEEDEGGEGDEETKKQKEEKTKERKEKKLAREEMYLRSMQNMNLTGSEVPSPPGSDFLDSASEEENEQLKGGNYLWSRGDVAHRGPERLGPIGRHAAKKAAKAARRRGKSPERDFGKLPRPGAVAETLRMMILSGGAYVGFQPIKSYESLQSLARIADAFGLAVELKGGGKRKHPVVRWTPRAFVPKADDERVAQAVAAAGGEYVPGGNWEGYDTGKGSRRDLSHKKQNGTLESNFISAGVMRDTNSNDDSNDTSDFETETEKDVAPVLDPLVDVDVAALSMDTMERENESSELEPRGASGLGSGGPGLGSQFAGLGSTSGLGANPTLGSFEPSTAEASLISNRVAVLDDGEDPNVVARDMSANRGLRRAAKAAEREATILDSRRRKLGIHAERSGGSMEKQSRSGKVVGSGEKFGAFEKHTSGFGSRMLAKMGFQGEGSGVGKGGTGIKEPITAEMRARRVGLGAEKGR